MVAKPKNSNSSKVPSTHGKVVLMHFSSPTRITVKRQSISPQANSVQKKMKIAFDVEKVSKNIYIRGCHGSSGKLNFPKNGHVSCGGGTRAERSLGIP